VTVTMGRAFRMTRKTRLFLWLYNHFDRVAQWFINNCDYEEVDD